MNVAQTDKRAATDQSAQTPDGSILSTEMHNDRSHDSTVDTDGKNREAARLAGHGAIGPDEVTTSNATLDNSLPEAEDGLAGFDSRLGGNHLLLALEPGCTVVEKGMMAPDEREHPMQTSRADPQLRGRVHFALNHRRPARIFELQRNK